MSRWGIERIEATVRERAETLRSMLRDTGFTVHDPGAVRCGIVTASSDRRPADELKTMLAEHGINVSTTHVDSSRWDVEQRDLPPMLRLSVHYTTTPDELTSTVGVLASAV